MPIQKGEGHYVTKTTGLTEAKVREIRQKYATPCPHCHRPPSMKELAALYGVSSVSIHNIIHRHSWKHVE